ncbi:15-methylpalmitoyl-4-hydroxy-2-pyrone synthase [Lentibacillus persicus]|uniref:15-methylpalmitoyl-4-hydroxy-2-pyrone synthase n=1 Tax=Lentibacillus persicus TaxID=640948 RepID=A0A1I1V1X1_9BACI|nr:3-oxoacyl-[acyl-carrier-protein] synthase III C-terminal domain-containing protein [Lentibacillus persicus]SFD76924.1 15-methylpalmitoyl-4-hydroxy-2-pyrone synthase [Lentibacillus persicus]
MISSIGLGMPPHDITQIQIKHLVKEIFKNRGSKWIDRILPVFDHALIDKRQFVVEADWFQNTHTFQEKNDLYQQLAVKHSLAAIDDCLTNAFFLKNAVPYKAIDMIIFTSSTGIAAPSLETFIMSERPFKENVARMPLWGLGCAGGAAGLSRAFDWVKAHPDKNVLLVCCELCSLTFQKEDLQKSNLVGTALFGDGIGAALVMGDRSKYLMYSKHTKPKITYTDSATMKNSQRVMGWDITNRGLEVIFSKSIPALVGSFWKKHIDQFFQTINTDQTAIHSFISHPGGKKVLEAMEDAVQAPRDKLRYSYEVLRNHGNMSSATVLYVLRQWMLAGVHEKQLSILSALGPGFSSELLLLEWVES